MEAKGPGIDKAEKQKELRTEIQELRKRNKFCESAVADLTVSADQLVETAADKCNFSKILESNAVRKRAREMQDEVMYVLDDNIKSKRSKLQSFCYSFQSILVCPIFVSLGFFLVHVQCIYFGKH